MNKFWFTGAAGIALAFLMTSPDLQAQTEPVRVIVIGAHPDDCDLDAGGTAILFAKMGHKVKFLSVTNGDAGHHEMGGGMLAARRRAEALEAGRRFGVEYEVLDNHDGELMPTLEIRKEIIRRIRRWNADVVISPRPNDYHPDHRYTAMLVQDAAYMVIVPNVAPDTPPLKKNPVFLYSSDGFKKPNPFQPDIAVDISSVWDQKVYAMSAHESQFFEWLPWTSGALAEVPSKPEDRLKWLSSWRGQEINDATRAALAFWYGDEHARGVRYVETFEICEYGRQPSREEITRLFPMIRKP